VARLCEAALGEVKAHSTRWAAVLEAPLYDGPRAQTTLERRRQVHGLLDQGVGLLECARRLQLALNTVKRCARADRPERMLRAPKYRADLVHLHAFARGPERDRDAVNAALTLPYSNGPTEGVNTKTKRIARQMHGRAGFTLLRHRILLGQQDSPSPPKVGQGRLLDPPKSWPSWAVDAVDTKTPDRVKLTGPGGAARPAES
jgi:hypothetical protein